MFILNPQENTRKELPQEHHQAPLTQTTPTNQSQASTCCVGPLATTPSSRGSPTRTPRHLSAGPTKSRRRPPSSPRHVGPPGARPHTSSPFHQALYVPRPQHNPFPRRSRAQTLHQRDAPTRLQHHDSPGKQTHLRRAIQKKLSLCLSAAPRYIRRPRRTRRRRRARWRRRRRCGRRRRRRHWRTQTTST